MIFALDAEGVCRNPCNDRGECPFILVSKRRLVVGRSTGSIEMLQRWSGAQRGASCCRRTRSAGDGRGGRSIADSVLDSEDMPVVIALNRRKSVSACM